MKNDQFLSYLQDSSNLSEIPFEDLELLYLKYPFSKNIQILYNKKRNILGLTQNKKPLEKLRAQHNHPFLLNQILDGSSDEEYESMNHLYESIFEEINPKKVDLEENTPESGIEMPIKLETIQEHTLNKQDAEQKEELENSHLFDIPNKVEAKEKQGLANQIRNKQFDANELRIQKKMNTPFEEKESSNIKFIEVEEFSPTKKSKSKRKKKQKKAIKKTTKSKTKKTRKIPKVETQKPEKEKTKKTKHKNKSTKKEKVKSKKHPKKKQEKLLINKALPARELDYFDWLDSLKSTEEVVTPKEKLPKKKKRKKSIKPKASRGTKKLKLQDKIDKSLERNDKIYTETLAVLMEKQGHKKQAIDIYKQLMVNNPEKSDYFANRIQKLK